MHDGAKCDLMIAVVSALTLTFIIIRILSVSKSTGSPWRCLVIILLAAESDHNLLLVARFKK
nr:MMPL family transporter [Mycobacterium uberis]